MMTDPGLAIIAAARPVIAGHVLASRIGCPVDLRASEDVMPVGRITFAGYYLATLVERLKGIHPMHHAVQAIQICGNLGTVGIEPGPWSDPVPGVYRVATLGAEIGAPGEVALVDTFRQVLADGIGPFKSP